MSDKLLNILITGGGSGIGTELAKALSSDGHNVVICGRRITKLKNSAKSGKNIRFFKCDVSNEKNVKKFFNYVKKNFSYIDVIINNAGVFGAIGRFDRTDSKLWKKTFDINTFGVYLITKNFLPLLLKSNVKKVINFAGGGAFSPFENYSAYAVSKASVVRLSENMAVELKSDGVKVNCIAPGFVATELHEATLKAGESTAGIQYRITKEKLEIGSVPVEVPVNCVRFLISNDAGELTGKTISANFDKWHNKVFKNYIKEINDSDLYTLRRINIVNLNKNDKLRDTLLKIK
ncbi:MAG: SDR family oxidoreductase [Spirochaetes bacterium]|nr:SDR family oxidoreductase [Spirochaetota bacterium]